MDRILCFKPHLRVERAGDGEVFLVGEHQRFLLAGRLHGLVAPLVDGRRTEQEIVAALEGKASPLEVLCELAMLEEKGYVAEAVPGLSSEAAAFWDALGAGAACAAERLAATPVSVLSSGGEDARPLAEALSLAGVAVEDDAALRVVVARDYLDPALAALNRRALGERFRWMPVKPTGATPWMGPMFRPGEGPCWACLAARLRANRPVETHLEGRLGRAEAIVPPRALVPASARAALDLAALSVARWIADGGRGAVDDKLLSLDLRSMRVEEHTVVRRPQCPACGDPQMLKKRAEEPIVIAPRQKRFTEDGGYRTVTPEETFARLEHLVSPVTGVVTRIGPVPGRDHPLRMVYGAGFFVQHPPDARPSFHDFSRASMGKGRTVAQSRTGALCEAIERHSAVLQGDEPLVRARMDELGGTAVHPHELLRFSVSQYQRREEINAGARDHRMKIPLPFREDASIDWAPVWSLTRGERRHVPAAYCYVGVPGRPDEQFCAFEPNGCAAGNCVEEAVLQAFFELAERDAVGIWWYNRLRRPAVNLQSFEVPYFTALEDHYRAMGYRLWVLDVTNDLEVPAFAALAHTTETDRWCVGFGCHREARLGVQRALTEIGQTFDPTGASRAPWGAAPLEDETFLFPDAAARPRRRGDFAEARGADLAADVAACVASAARWGHEVLILDHTRPDVGLHAIKLMVPGLRHFWPRLGPGRLYDVPVRMGWIDAPLEEARLNPVPLYL